MKKYLLIGSAPYIRDWYELNGQAFFKAGFELVAMNNAWVVDPDKVKYWIHANDFHVNGTHHPTTKHKEGWKENETDDREVVAPYTYQFKEGTGTTILNTLCQILNWGERCIVAIAGSDCVYDGDKSHFYEGGTSDPLRYGEEWLVTELERVGRFYETECCQIFNVGGQERSLLPYEKKTPKDLIL